MRLGHVPALDAIRGIAILLVLAVHSGRVLPGGLVPGGVLGVDLFFVLSGFLITSLLLNEWDRDGRISFGGFYRRRALRLLPALVVMLGVVTVVAAFTVDDFRGEFVWVLSSLAYVTNLASLQERGIGAENLQHMWSLSQEEQFYLVWPLLLVLVLRARVRPRTLAVALGGLTVTVIAYRALLETAGASLGYLWYAPDTRSDGLILGCLAGVLFSYGLVRQIPLWLPSVLLVPACIAVVALSLESRWHAVLLLPAFCISATVVLLASVLHPRWWFTRLIDRAWLRGLGKISYGLYLWHWPIFFAFGWKLGLPLALLVALLSYRFVEQPFLHRRHAHQTRHSVIPRTPPALPANVAPATPLLVPGAPPAPPAVES